MAQTSKLEPLARIAPNNVPRVFVIMSVIPELLEGINPCNISIVKLMIAPAKGGHQDHSVRWPAIVEIHTEEEPERNKASDIYKNVLGICVMKVEFIPRSYQNSLV